MFTPGRYVSRSYSRLCRPATRLTLLKHHLSSPVLQQSFTSFQRHTMSTSSLPSNMRAIVVNKTGGPEVLEFQSSHPVPSLSSGQVLIRNKFAGINYIDTYFRSGLYPSTMPVILGQEASGTVAAVKGDSYGLKEGDRVVFIKQGCYAEYTAVNADRVVKIADDVSDEDGVGGYLMGMTALSLVQESYPVQKGDWVLLHAAAGGVGLLMCQILKSLGAHTIGTAGGPEKCQMAKDAGAEYMIDYKDSSVDWLERVKEITKGEGVAVVYDSVGQDTWEKSLQAIRRKGKVVYFGSSSGPIPPFPVAKLSANNASIMRSTLMQYIVTREELEHYAGDLFKMMRSGNLKVNYHKTYALEDVAEAHRDLQGRKTTGKLLLKI